MSLCGHLRKMDSSLGPPVSYRLDLGGTGLDANARIGEPLHLRFTGTIHCVLCGRSTRKSFGDGLCYPCFRDAPEASPCIIRPELCEGHLGRGRDPAWEAAHHVQLHVVYLALTSGLKVGVTRATNLPSRWIDQGAWRAVVLATTPNRYLAGCIEVSLKEHVSDRTHWQAMLKSAHPSGGADVDLAAEKRRLLGALPAELRVHGTQDDAVTELTYPVRAYPAKVKSISLDKTPQVDGVLWGIKGQYWLWQDGRVLNVRKHAGYEIELSF